MKTRLSLLMVVAVGVIGMTGIAAGQAGGADLSGIRPLPQGPGHLRGPGGQAMRRPWDDPDPVAGLQRVLRRLNLTDGQEQQVKGILEANREGLRHAKQARAAAMKAYVESVQAGEEAGIREAAANVGKAIADVAVIRTQTAAAIKAVLTPEQIDKLEKMKERAKEARGQNLAQDGRGQRRGLAGQGNRQGLRRTDRPERPRKAECLDLLTNEKFFKRIDLNNDGAITLREIRAFQKQRDKDRPDMSDGDKKQD